MDSAIFSTLFDLLRKSCAVDVDEDVELHKVGRQIFFFCQNFHCITLSLESVTNPC